MSVIIRQDPASPPPGYPAAHTHWDGNTWLVAVNGAWVPWTPPAPPPPPPVQAALPHVPAAPPPPSAYPAQQPAPAAAPYTQHSPPPGNAAPMSADERAAQEALYDQDMSGDADGGKLLSPNYGHTGRTRLHCRIIRQKYGRLDTKKTPFVKWNMDIIASDNPVDFPVGSRCTQLIKLGAGELTAGKNIMTFALGASGYDVTEIIAPRKDPNTGQLMERGTVAKWADAHQPLSGVEVVIDIEVQMSKGRQSAAHPFGMVNVYPVKGRTLRDLERGTATEPTAQSASPHVTQRTLEEYMRLPDHELYTLSKRLAAVAAGGAGGGYAAPPPQHQAPAAPPPPAASPMRQQFNGVWHTVVGGAWVADPVSAVSLPPPPAAPAIPPPPPNAVPPPPPPNAVRVPF